MHMNRILGYMKAQFIGLTHGDARFGSSSRHPHGEGLWVVIATATAVKGGAGFNHGGASKFTTPYHQGIFEHAQSLQILNQGGTCLIDCFCLIFHISFHIAVCIPSAVV